MGNIASSISAKDFLKVYTEIANTRFFALDVEAALLYMVDTVPASALDALSQQFDVQGVKGFQAATTEEDKREIIRRSIELHRYKGTPYAIKEVCKSLGFVDVEILEGLAATVAPLEYNGEFLYNGEFNYSDAIASPFNFSVTIGADDVASLTPELRTKMIRLINEYKNIRSRLTAIAYNKTIRPTYNGDVDYDGEINYDYNIYVIQVNV